VPLAGKPAPHALEVSLEQGISDCDEPPVPRSPFPVPRPWIIPPAVIDRPPSAELREDQTDQDSLPPYDVLDAILQRFIEGEQSQADIAAAGFDADTVRRVASLVLRNEFKRRQAAPGPRVTTRAFGRERRYPITSGWK
jgi:NAD+ synthase (glutamine-hydrolysing)